MRKSLKLLSGTPRILRLSGMGLRLLHTARVLASSMSAAKPVIKVDIWSDIACPWCYIGKKRLDQAMETMRDQAVFKPEWHAYLLEENGGYVAEGLSHMEHYRGKFGSRAGSLDETIRKAGQADGAAFKGWEWRGNTMAGHRLIALARRHGKDHEASELLFRKAYEEGANLSDTAEVVDVGERLGLPGVAEYVGDQSAGREEVEEDDMFGKMRLEVSGVPLFLVGLEDSQKRYSFSGAQPPDNFSQIFSKLLQEAAAAGSVGEGQVATAVQEGKAAGGGSCDATGGCQ